MTIVDEQSNAIESATRLSMVGIAVVSGDETGTLIRWRGHHLILTAAHVIGRILPEDIQFLFPPDSPPTEVSRETLWALTSVPRKALQASSAIKLSQFVMDPAPGLDLAAIEVDGSIEEKYPVRFFDLAEGGRTPAEDQMTIITGFPLDISRLTGNNERLVFPQSEWTQVVPDGEHLLGDFDPAKHFLAPYNLTETYPDANLKGMSGAAMWFRRGPTPDLWHSNLDIAGVVITWYPRVSLMKMVRREIVEGFLTEAVSDEQGGLNR
jgi:hypothetical protein